MVAICKLSSYKNSIDIIKETIKAYISPTVKGGRGSALMVAKCKLCSRENSIDILKETIRPYSNDAAQFQTIVAFDCRGLEPIEFEVH